MMLHWIDEMDFGHLCKNNPCGFSGFKTVEELEKEKCASVPGQMGVYLVLCPSTEKPGFTSWPDDSSGKMNKPKTSDALAANWISGSHIVYIGKAGGPGFEQTLRKRLQGYLQGRGGKKGPHQGGRDIWQIENPEQLIFVWRVMEDEDPRTCEKTLLDKFKSEFGRYPFANKQG